MRPALRRLMSLVSVLAAFAAHARPQPALAILEAPMKGYRVWLGDLPDDIARGIAWGNGVRLFGLKD